MPVLRIRFKQLYRTLLLAAAGLLAIGCDRTHDIQVPRQITGETHPQKPAPVPEETNEQQSDQLNISFLNVAPGNCIIMTTPAGKHILIDAGPAGSAQDIQTHLEDLHITKLDYVIVTSPTEEHAGCLPSLINGMSTGQVLTSGVDSPVQAKIREAAASSGAKLSTLRSGSLFAFDDQVSISVIAPAEQFTRPPAPDANWYDNHSLVFKLHFGKVDLLFTGDAGRDERQWMYDNAVNLHAALVSGLHHGDSAVGDLDFIHRITPSMAFIMCQPRNRQHYPHRETLDAFQACMVRFFRTDLQGTIDIHVQREGGISVLPARAATEHDMSLPGSEYNGSGDPDPIQLNNPVDQGNGVKNPGSDLLH